MGTSHLYVVDTSIFNYSFGYPLQDNAITGHTSMQYGIDQRVNGADVETDLGVALDMVEEGELPSARNVPIRTIISQMIEEIPGVDIYPPGDDWHLSSDANKAIATYMYTILTGECALDGQPEPTDSTEWRTWMAHKIGYTTAWTLMHMEGQYPCYGSTLSITENQELNFGFLAYPNPTNGKFTIDLGDKHNSITATITDLVGNKIHRDTYKNSQYLKFTLNEPKGIYFVILEMEDKKSIIKIIIE
ncbi:MAG: T9SS type A sorting domain-containing protein [Crocinitomicaceae bacterium]|nr:T9SS type A sorting domain-containing protein [Crocinitomicaceae bacterium]